jgi:hypothetical protein
LVSEYSKLKKTKKAILSALNYDRSYEDLKKWIIIIHIVKEWDVWPQGPRLQGEDGGKAGARGSNKTTEQPNNRTSTRHRNIINIHQDRT